MLAFILPSLAAAISFLSRRGLAGPPPSGGGWGGALSKLSGVIRLSRVSSPAPPLQLSPSPALPRDKAACSRGVRPPAPAAVPASVPPAGIAAGAGSPRRPGLRPAPDFPRSDFSSTNEGKRKKERDFREPEPRGAPGETPAWPGVRGRPRGPSARACGLGRAQVSQAGHLTLCARGLQLCRGLPRNAPPSAGSQGWGCSASDGRFPPTPSRPRNWGSAGKVLNTALTNPGLRGFLLLLLF